MFFFYIYTHLVSITCLEKLSRLYTHHSNQPFPSVIHVDAIFRGAINTSMMNLSLPEQKWLVNNKLKLALWLQFLSVEGLSNNYNKKCKAISKVSDDGWIPFNSGSGFWSWSFLWEVVFQIVRRIYIFSISRCANALVSVVLNQRAHYVVKMKPNSVRCNLCSKVLDF